MNCDTNKKFTELIVEFYMQEKKMQKPLGMPLFDVLRNLLAQRLQSASDNEIRAFIRESYDEYIKNNKVPRESQKRESFDRNMRDWLSDSYKGIWGNFAKDIDRASILTIAFVLGFSDQMCNKMLLAVNQHPLHRGDVSENIIIHCLKEGKSFSHAEKIYQCFEYLGSNEPHIKLEQGDVSFSKRTEFVKDKMALTDIHQLTKDFDFSLEFKELVLKWEKDNTNEELFDNKDIQVIKNLIVLQNYFNKVSQRTLSSIHKNTEINSLASRSFLKKLFNPKKETIIKSANSISNVFADFNKAISSRGLSHPTRAFVIMMGIVSWCQLDNTTISLEEYVNTLLVEELCNFRPLDSVYSDDRFVMELNKYVFKKLSEKKGIIYYHFNDDEYYSVVFEQKNNFITKQEAFQTIISGYLENPNNTLRTSEWKNSYQFFDFSTFKQKTET